MKLAQHHKDKLLEISNKVKSANTSRFLGGFVWIDESFKGQLFEEVDVFEFINLYPNIICLLYDEGFKLEGELENINKIKYYLQNRNQLRIDDNQKYIEYRTFVNGYYGYLAKPYNPVNSYPHHAPKIEGIIICTLVCEYMYMIYDELLENNSNILYIDTDSIFHVGNMKLPDISLPFEKSGRIDIIFEGKKKYVLYDGNRIYTKGYKSKTRSDIESEMIINVRNKKLNKIGI